MKTEYCLGLAFRDDDVLLMVKDHPEWQKGKLNGIGGHLERNEGFNEAMIREFKEETGVNTKFDDWKFFQRLTITDKDENEHIIFCLVLRPDFSLPTVFVERNNEAVQWFDLYDLNIHNTVEHLPWIIQLALEHQRHGLVRIFYSSVQLDYRKKSS